MNHKTNYHVLRVGMAITFLWIGILILKAPASWGGYLQPWAYNLLPGSIESVMIATAVLDIGIGIIFLIDWQTWIAGILATVHIVMVLTVVGISDVTVRDIGLLAACLVTTIESLPLTLQYKLLKKLNYPASQQSTH